MHPTSLLRKLIPMTQTLEQGQQIDEIESIDDNLGLIIHILVQNSSKSFEIVSKIRYFIKSSRDGVQLFPGFLGNS